MNYWLVNPKYDGQGTDISNLDIHTITMGWGKEKSAKFFDDIKPGDIIVASSHSHINCVCHYAGIAGILDEENRTWHLKYSVEEGLEGVQNTIRSNPESFPGGESPNPYGSSRSVLQLGNSVPEELVKTKLNRIMAEEINRETLKEKVELLENSRNLVLTGAPGTGKTYSARNITANLTAGKDWRLLDADEKRRIGFVQFHQSYDYTDFVEGLRPVSGESSVGFALEMGIFKSFCAEALKDTDKKYVFIIDEINRGEVSRIFGELLFSLDPDYRGETGRVKTQYQNMITDPGDPFYSGFYVPENVYIIGTMNDIDRSVDSLDFAFRRRFNWVEITAEESKAMFSSPKAWKYKNGNLSGIPGNIDEIKARMDRLNEEIVKPEYGLGREYQIGAAYFLKYSAYLSDDSADSSDKAFDSLWKYNLEPLLREYLRGTGKNIEKLKAAYDNTTAPADDIE